MIECYRSRISGPLLDRIDLHVEVPAASLRELRGQRGEGSSEVAERVAAARRRQQERFTPDATLPVNGAMGPEPTRRHCRVDAPGQRLLDAAFERLGLSARALHRVLRVARTIADLTGAREISSGHVAEAIQYRSSTGGLQ